LFYYQITYNTIYQLFKILKRRPATFALSDWCFNKATGNYWCQIKSIFNPPVMARISFVPKRGCLCTYCAFTVHLLCYYCTKNAQYVHSKCTVSNTSILLWYNAEIVPGMMISKWGAKLIYITRYLWKIEPFKLIRVKSFPLYSYK